MTTPSTNQLVDQFLEKFVGELIRDARQPVQKAGPRRGESRKKTKKATELVDLHVEEVSAVDRPANKRKFLIVKRAKGDQADAIVEARKAHPLVGQVADALEAASAPVAKAMTFADAMVSRQVGRVMDELSSRYWAFVDVVDSILLDVAEDNKADLIETAVTAYVESVRAAIPGLLEDVSKMGDGATVAQIREALEPLSKEATVITETTTHREALAKELREYLTPPVTKGDAPPETLRSLAWGTIETIAKKIREDDPTLTQEAAIVQAMDRVPALVEAYNAGVARGEPAEFASAPVAKRELPMSDAWGQLETLAKARLEKGGAKTLEQALELVGKEHPDLYAQAFEE